MPMPRFFAGQRPFILAVAVAAITALFLHFWRIGSAPSGFYGDECSIAYNAYCIAETGADEYGTPYPVFFRGFDNYHDPAMVYALVPLIKVFGLEVWAARFPSAFFHILASVAFAFLVQGYCRNRWLSLAGGVLFSVVPWTFPVSRTISAGYTAMLFGMAAGWFWLLRAFGREWHGYAAAAGVAWAFAMYAHNIGRPMTALLLVGFIACFNCTLLSRWRVGLTFATTYLAALLPMIICVLRTPQALTTRFQTMSIFQGHPSLSALLERFGSRFVDYFSPRFLLMSGDSNLRHHTGFAGELFWFTIPLIVAGLYCVVRFFRTQPYYRFLMISLLVYPAAAALTVNRMHSMRCVNGVIAWLLLAMVGARWLWQQRRVGRTLLAALCVVGLIEAGAYLADYFGPYQTRCRVAFGTAFTEAVKYCFNRIGTNQTLYVSGSVSAPCSFLVDLDLKPYLYAYLLFYGRIDPWSYQHGGLSHTIVQPYFDHIDQPGLFLRCNCMPLLREGTQVLAVANIEPVPTQAKLLATFQDQAPFEYQVFEIKR